MAKAKKSVELNDDERPVRAIGLKRIEKVSPTYSQMYVNDVQVQMTPWDFRLRLGVIDNVDSEAQQVHLTALADVRVSPQHAKKIAEVLVRLLDTYEKTVGPIPQPGDD